MLTTMTKRLPLGNGLYTVVDDEDYELLNRFKWRVVKSGGDSQSFYAVATMRLHRLIKECPKGLMVDHINGDTLDNRQCNLRVCTNSQNQQNTDSRGGSSKYKNVSYSSRYNKWYGKFRYNGHEYFCGYHDTEDQCRQAVIAKRTEICPEFSRSVSSKVP